MALSREQRKFLAWQRAERRLMHRLGDIDWEIDELDPAVKEIGKLEANNKVEIEIRSLRGNEDHT